MSATSIPVEPVDDEPVCWFTIGVTSAAGATSSKAPTAQAPASAALPPSRDAAASTASGLAVEATQPERVASGEVVVSVGVSEEFMPPL